MPHHKHIWNLGCQPYMPTWLYINILYACDILEIGRTTIHAISAKAAAGRMWAENLVYRLQIKNQRAQGAPWSWSQFRGRVWDDKFADSRESECIIEPRNMSFRLVSRCVMIWKNKSHAESMGWVFSWECICRPAWSLVVSDGWISFSGHRGCTDLYNDRMPSALHMNSVCRSYNALYIMRQVLGLQPLVLKVLKSDTKQTQQKDKNSWLCLHLCRRQHSFFHFFQFFHFSSFWS